MSKLVYLGMSMIELSKIAMYQLWYDHVRPKYGQKEKLHYMDANRFTVYTKTEDIYKEIAEDVKTRFETLNYKLVEHSLKEKIEK